MNVLLVLYHDFSANSAVHVHNFANQLAARGHTTAVAYPEGKDAGTGLGEQNYGVATFPEVSGEWSVLFENAQPPDVVHAWTPRENVRLFCEKLRSLCRFALFIHLEDNEELILEVNLGKPFAELARTSSIKFPHNLSHPLNYQRFLSAADGVTMIMDRLEKFVPHEVARTVLWPGADTRLFHPQPRDRALLESLGIPEDHLVFCYTGNVHSANARDVRSLYVAAAILTREGIPTTLLRTGKDYCSFLGPDEQWARDVSIELGYLPYDDIARVLSLSDLLIQPGGDNAFNEFRLPGKLPEFFAMGKPVILPSCNVGRFTRHGQDAWVLPKVDALGIVDAIHHLRAEPTLAERLSLGAQAFCAENFSWEKNTASLETFYEQVLAAA